MDKEEYEYPHICATITEGLFGIPHTKALNHQQMMALMGPEMCYDEPGAFAAVEIKVKDFIQLPGGKEAIEKELNEMRRRRFNDDEDIPEYLKRSALECRIICTTKRDGTMKQIPRT